MAEKQCNGTCEVCICKNKSYICHSLKDTKHLKNKMKSIKALLILSIGMIGLTAFATTSEPEQESKSVTIENVNCDYNVVSAFDFKQTLDFTAPTEVVTKMLVSTDVDYKKGDKFKGPNGEEITLIKIREVALGINSWKAEMKLNGKKHIVYLTMEYLKQCSPLPR